MLDMRVNRHGYAIGQRSDHEWAAEAARWHIEQARFYRRQARGSRIGMGRGMARYHLAQAARWRRSFADRITPAGVRA